MVEYGLDIDLRDRLIQSGVVRLDGGGFVIADLTPAHAAVLAGRGHALTGLDHGAEEELWIVPGRHGADHESHEGIERDAPGVTELFASEVGARVVATSRDLRAERALAGDTHGHCGLQPVPRRALVPAPPVVWRGRVGAGAVAAMTTGDPRVQTLVDQVDKANLQATVNALTSNFTRFAQSSGAVAAQGDLEAWAGALGLNVSTQLFDPSMSRNVIAEIPGTVSPEKVVVIGAHYDSVNWQDGTSAVSRGADDNASGSAGVLEAARVLSQGGPFEHTLRFVWFSGEELGLLGAFANAQASASAGEELIAMLNMDMIAYRAPGDTRDVDFATNNTTSSLNELAQALGALYVPNWAFQEGVLTAGSSDHAAYFQTGFPATFFFEDLQQSYPSIHTALDTTALATVDFDLAEMIVGGVVATAATLAEPVDMSIAHTPLGDSLNGFGPYLVQADVTSLTGASVSAVDLIYAVDGGPDTVLAMTNVAGDTFEVLMPGVGSPKSVTYQLQAFDTAGGTELAPEGLDARFSFFVGTKTVVYADDFEGPGDGGWTHGQVATQDDWQRGTPAGKAGDPASAVSGQNAWGNDLGGSGFNGEYQPDVNNWLRSPAIDASAANGLVLEFQRWLTVETAVYDQAQVWVGGQLVWENSAGGDTVDSAWTPVALDVAGVADGDPSVQVEFRLLSDGGLEFGGWNIDDLALVEYGPAPLPPSPSFALSPSAVEAIGGQIVRATGAGMAGVTSVTIGGASVPFEVAVDEVRFVVPAQTDLTDKAVQITNVTGTGSATLNVLMNGSTQLVGPTSGQLGGTVSFTVGAPSGLYTWLLYSGASGTTQLPGAPDLGLGGGQLALVKIGGQGPLNAAGNRTFAPTLPQTPTLSGLALQVEGLVFDPVAGFSTTGAQAFAID